MNEYSWLDVYLKRLGENMGKLSSRLFTAV